MKKKSKRSGTILIAIGLVLMAAAVSLAVYNIWDDSRAAGAAEEVLGEFKMIRDKQIAENKESISYDPLAGMFPEDEDELVPEYVIDPDMPMPAITVKGYRYIGTVTIPALEIELPFMEQWDYTRMKIAPCRYSGSVYRDDLVICAHNYNSHFGSLDDLQINDEIIITDAAGNVFRYLVAETKLLSGTAVNEMTSGNWDLTLFTCNYSGFARVTVRCNRIDK